MWKITVTTFVLFLVQSLAESADTCDKKLQRPQALMLTKLLGDVILNITVNNFSTCQELCNSSRNCQSWNFHFVDNKCQLMNISRFYEGAHLVREPQWIHMENSDHPCSKQKYPCKNGGLCLRSNDTVNNTDYQCLCEPGYNGTDCFEKYSLCLTAHPCLNNGTCTDIDGGYKCNCSSMYKGTKCQHRVQSCNDIHKLDRSLGNGAYYIGSSPDLVYCHMDSIPGCGEGGWTLAIKMNGRMNTFKYSSHLWSNKQTYDPEAGATGLDDRQTKLATYWTLPFESMCLGMKADGNNRWLKVDSVIANTLYDIIADGRYRSITNEKSDWINLLNGGSLQDNCLKSGFNSYGNNPYSCRIGIVGNNENNCFSIDSGLGFGCNNHIVCGNNRVCCGIGVQIYAFGYIFIK